MPSVQVGNPHCNLHGYYYLLSLTLQPSAGYGLLVPQGFVITHNDAPQSVELLLDECISSGLYWLHAVDALVNLSVLEQDKICGKLSGSFLKPATILRAGRYKNGDTVCCSMRYHVLRWLSPEKDTRLPPFAVHCIEILPVIFHIMWRLPFPVPFVILC
jgi:hypothetical protein